MISQYKRLSQLWRIHLSKNPRLLVLSLQLLQLSLCSLLVSLECVWTVVPIVCGLLCRLLRAIRVACWQVIGLYNYGKDSNKPDE